MRSIKARTFKKWFDANFTKTQKEDIANHGASGGFPNITYYSDTGKIYDKFQDEIWEMLNDAAKDQGMMPLELFVTFQGAKDIWSGTTFENLMVWFAVETLAQEYAG